LGKSRKSIPKAVKEKVLKEYNYRCAICGNNRPQLHHIDENPENNIEFNLIPLCPNCHLTDQHNSTQPFDPDLLSLFRRFKDPLILKPQFHPIFLRLRFLYNLDEYSKALELDEKAEELVEFIGEMKMGSFYSKRLAELVRMHYIAMPILLGNEESERFAAESFAKSQVDYLNQLNNVQEKVEALVVEILKYQDWQL